MTYDSFLAFPIRPAVLATLPPSNALISIAKLVSAHIIVVSFCSPSKSASLGFGPEILGIFDFIFVEAESIGHLSSFCSPPAFFFGIGPET